MELLATENNEAHSQSPHLIYTINKKTYQLCFNSANVVAR